MGLHLPAALREAQAFVGLPFPATDESALRGRADEWERLATLAADAEQQVARASDDVARRNLGPTVDAFAEFMASGGGNVGSLRDFQRACRAAAAAHVVAATMVLAVKTLMLAQLAVVQSALTVAKAVPQAVPWAYQVRQQAFVVLQRADAMTAQQLRAG